MPDDDALCRAVDELTLRDHFACAALPAIITAESGHLLPYPDPVPPALVARKAYDVAEAMLAERAARAESE